MVAQRIPVEYVRGGFHRRNMAGRVRKTTQTFYNPKNIRNKMADHVESITLSKVRKVCCSRCCGVAFDTRRCLPKRCFWCGAIVDGGDALCVYFCLKFRFIGPFMRNLRLPVSARYGFWFDSTMRMEWEPAFDSVLIYLLKFARAIRL